MEADDVLAFDIWLVLRDDVTMEVSQMCYVGLMLLSFCQSWVLEIYQNGYVTEKQSSD